MLHPVPNSSLVPYSSYLHLLHRVALGEVVGVGGENEEQENPKERLERVGAEEQTAKEGRIHG